MVAAITFHSIPTDTKTVSVETNRVGWPGTPLLVTIAVFVPISCIAINVIPLEVWALETMFNTIPS